MSTIASLNVVLSATTGPLSKGLAAGSAAVGKFANSFKGIGGVIGGALSTAMGPVGLVISGVAGIAKAFDAAGESEAAVKKLNGVLAATGNVTGFTSAELQTMAGDLQNVTNFEDDATISAMGVLATFKSIKGDTFKDAIGSAMDLSAVMGQDLQASVVQIGKALNDPIKGVMALKKVGVSFSEEQIKMIKSLQKSGDLLGAQGIILSELKGEFGGAAQAMASPFEIFKNKVGDMMEELGAIIRPIAGVAVSAMTPLVSAFSAGFHTIASVVTPIMGVVSSMLTTGIASAVAFISPLWTSFTEFLGTTFLNVVDYLAPVFVALYGTAHTIFSALLDIGMALWSGLSTAFMAIAEVIGTALGSVGVNMQSVAEWGRWMMDMIQGALLVIEFGFARWRDVGNLALLEIGLGIVTFANQTIYFFTVALPGYLDWFGQHWYEVFIDLVSITETVCTNIWTNLKNLWDGIVGLFNGDGFKFEWTPLTEGFTSAITELPKIAEREIGPLEKSLTEEVGALKGALSQDFADFAESRTQELEVEAADFREGLGDGFGLGGLDGMKPPDFTGPTAPDKLNAGPGENAKVGALVKGSAEAFKAATGTTAADKQLEIAKEQLKEQKAQTEALETIADATDEEAAEIP